MVTNDSFYCYPVTIKLINCPCHHGADGLLEPTAVFCFVLSWRHNNVTLGIGTVWRMTTSFAVVQSPVAVKDRVLTPFLDIFLSTRFLGCGLTPQLRCVLPEDYFVASDNVRPVTARCRHFDVRTLHTRHDVDSDQSLPTATSAPAPTRASAGKHSFPDCLPFS